MTEKPESSFTPRSACGYRNQLSCANCTRVFRDLGRCGKHGFVVNMDRGICDDFDNIANAPKLKKVRRPCTRPG